MPKKYGNKTKGKSRMTKGKGLSRKEKAEVKKMIKVDQQYKQSNWFSNNIAIGDASDTKEYICLTDGLAPGVGDVGQRIGDKIMIKSVMLRFTLAIALNAQNANNCVTLRCMCFQWHPLVDGTTANLLSSLPLNQVLEPGATVTNPDPTSQYKWDSKQDYKILYDKVVQLSSPSGVTATSTVYNDQARRHIVVRVPIKYAQKHIQFNAGSSHIATNHLFFVVFGYTAGGTVTTPPTCFLSSRVLFVDA